MKGYTKNNSECNKKYPDETEEVKDPKIQKEKSESIKEIEENDNYILAEINIEKKDINRDIRIINDNYEKEIKENCII